MARTAGLLIAGLITTVAHIAWAQVPFNPATRSALTLVRLEVNGGKLQLLARHQGRTQSAFHNSSRDRTERMRVTLTGGDPSIDYLLTTPTHQVKIDVRDKQSFSVRQEALNNSAVLPLSFTQSPEGPLTLLWGAGETKGRRKAPTLWHLCLQEPAICRQHLLPLIELLRPDWKLAETVDLLTKELFEIARLDRQGSQQYWRSLVTDLGSESYARRQAADRQLRAQGLAIRSFLENYDRSQLDSEQHWRMRMILKMLAKRADSDSPAAIAQWLAGDPLVWLALLDDADASRRQRASEELSRILEEPIDFDPLGPESQREAQLKALRERLEEEGVPIRVRRTGQDD